MVTTFLAAVDGSESSRRAARFAAERARCEGAALVLLHVVEWSRFEPVAPRDLETRHVEREKEIDHARKDLLEPLAAEVRAAGAEDVRVLVHHGRPAESICDAVGEVGATQVFTGRRGRGRLEALVLGGVSRKLVHACSVPVTVVP